MSLKLSHVIKMLFNKMVQSINDLGLNSYLMFDSSEVRFNN